MRNWNGVPIHENKTIDKNETDDITCYDAVSYDVIGDVTSDEVLMQKLII